MPPTGWAPAMPVLPDEPAELLPPLALAPPPPPAPLPALAEEPAIGAPVTGTRPVEPLLQFITRPPENNSPNDNLVVAFITYFSFGEF